MTQKIIEFINYLVKIITSLTQHDLWIRIYIKHKYKPCWSQQPSLKPNYHPPNLPFLLKQNSLVHIWFYKVKWYQTSKIVKLFHLQSLVKLRMSLSKVKKLFPNKSKNTLTQCWLKLQANSWGKKTPPTYCCIVNLEISSLQHCNPEQTSSLLLGKLLFTDWFRNSQKPNEISNVISDSKSSNFKWTAMNNEIKLTRQLLSNLIGWI